MGAVSATQEDPPEFDLVIEAGKGLRAYSRDLWRYRGLFFFLAWRDILVLYKQTAIGIAWAVLRPLVAMAVFTVVFGKIARLPAEGVPYPVLVFSAMIPWQMFAVALSESSGSLVANSNLISKVYFPRILVPASAVATAVVDMGISLCILFVMMIAFGVLPTWRIVALPIFVLLGLALAFGAGTWFSALSVKYRDFRYVVPFVVQLGMYVSPVGFSVTAIPAQWRQLYAINPMVGVIEGFRWAINGGTTSIVPLSILSSCVWSVVLCVTGFSYFRRVERTFADVI